MSPRIVHWRLVWGVVLVVLTIGAAVRLAQVTAAPAPAAIENVVAAMNREIANVVIANHTFIFSTALHTKDRDGAAVVLVSSSWPTEAHAKEVGEASRKFFLQAETLCRRFGRRFDSSYFSEFPYIDPNTHRTRVDIRFWISRPSVK